jgi:hypothetical protein
MRFHSLSEDSDENAKPDEDKKKCIETEAKSVEQESPKTAIAVNQNQ